MAIANTQSRAAVSALPAASMSETLSQRQIILVMLSVMLGMLLAALDQTIVGTAMPRVIAELNGLEHYAWVFTAYLLASTVTVPIYGKLSDIYGRRAFFVGGIGSQGHEHVPSAQRAQPEHGIGHPTGQREEESARLGAEKVAHLLHG